MTEEEIQLQYIADLREGVERGKRVRDCSDKGNYLLNKKGATQVELAQGKLFLTLSKKFHQFAKDDISPTGYQAYTEYLARANKRRAEKNVKS